MIKERVDKLICNWSLMNSHSFTESELNSLVDLIGDECENENLALKDLAESLRVTSAILIDTVEQFLPKIQQWDGSIGEIQAIESVLNEAKQALGSVEKP